MRIELEAKFVYDPTDIADVMTYKTKSDQLIKAGYKELFRFVNNRGDIEITFTYTQEVN